MGFLEHAGVMQVSWKGYQRRLSGKLLLMLTNCCAFFLQMEEQKLPTRKEKPSTDKIHALPEQQPWEMGMRGKAKIKEIQAMVNKNRRSKEGLELEERILSEWIEEEANGKRKRKSNVSEEDGGARSKAVVVYYDSDGDEM
jgi:hypothetical protein